MSLEKLIEGKTKIVWQHPEQRDTVIIESKDDITAGDGARRESFPGKAVLANQTTCNVFRLLQQCGMPVAFLEQRSATEFVARRCDMVHYEVVARRLAFGSYLKRNPHVRKGHNFPSLVVEFFLKTSGRKWQQSELPCDDPFVRFCRVLPADTECMRLYRPDQPFPGSDSFLVLEDFPLGGKAEIRDVMATIARRVFLTLEKAWQLAGGTLIDYKVEFGFAGDQILLADVIDADSWRLDLSGMRLDKDGFRQGEGVDATRLKYERAAELTGRFGLPKQRVIIWRGSENDDVTVFVKALDPFKIMGVDTIIETCSAHKQPAQAYRRLQELVREVPDCVVIAFIGRSNGAGPTLAANTHVPVISVPSTWKEFPDDVWSSLRLPSNVPALTILDPANAVLAALQMLAMRNPALYAHLRMNQEERLMNLVEL